jgi:hypothetical protein
MTSVVLLAFTLWNVLKLANEWPKHVGGNNKRYIYIYTYIYIYMYKVVQIWSGQTVTCLHTNRPGHIWTTLYNNLINVHYIGLRTNDRLISIRKMRTLIAQINTYSYKAFAQKISKNFHSVQDMFTFILLRNTYWKLVQSAYSCPLSYRPLYSLPGRPVGPVFEIPALP